MKRRNFIKLGRSTTGYRQGALLRDTTLVVLVTALTGCDAFGAKPASTSAVSVDVPSTPAVTVMPAVSRESECVPHVDADGDGVFVDATVQCPGQALLALLKSDCDDNDPDISRFEQYCLDADGDGLCQSTFEYACVGQPPPGYVLDADTPVKDCDDADAKAQVMRSFDGDGDGQGVGEPRCVGIEDPRYTEDTLVDDCDDTNAAIRSQHMETAFDEVDSNCDGAEYPVSYYQDERIDSIPFTMPDEYLCAGEGLSIVGAQIWGEYRTTNTTSGGFIVVGNRGTQTTSGATMTARLLNGAPLSGWEIPTLGPGEMAQIGPLRDVGVHWLTLYVPVPSSSSSSPEMTNAASPEPMHAVVGDGGEPAIEAGVPSSETFDAAVQGELPPCTAVNREGTIDIPTPNFVNVP